jgi:hypothetical protein
MYDAMHAGKSAKAGESPEEYPIRTRSDVDAIKLH